MLKLDGEGPLYVRTYRTLRQAILDGRFPSDARLPSTRALAVELGVSRTVTLAAFEQLAAEGYVIGKRGSGTRVASQLPEQVLLAQAHPVVEALPQHAPRISRYGIRALAQSPLVEHANPEAPRYDFTYGFAPPEPESQATWRRLLKQAALDDSLDYQPPEGNARLRVALARHLHRHRGISCNADQIVLVGGSQQALDLCTRLLLNPGESVLIEDPHYQGARAILLGAGARLTPVAVDGDGLDVRAPACARLHPRLIYVTPSHQFPTGAVMPLARRMALLEWAAARDAFIIEDDYDGDFRYQGRPIEAVRALDTHGRTLYVGTLSKVLFPALRVGFLVLPPSLVPLFRAGKWMADRHSPSLQQIALASFLESGLYERHIRRMRRRHGARRDALIDAITRHLGDRVEVMGTDAGIHLVLWLNEVEPSQTPDVIASAAERGVGLYSIEPYYLRPPERAGLLLGYGTLDESEIEEGVKRLAEVLAHRNPNPRHL